MKIFSNANYDVLPLKDFKLFLDFENASFPSKDSEHGKHLIALADKALEAPIPFIFASKYRKFAENGDRTEFEGIYFPRRTLLVQLLVGEILQNECKYIDKIIDILYAILEETTWVIPAHNKPKACGEMSSQANSDHADALQLSDNYDGVFTYIDLFSAETAAIISLVYHYIGDKIEKVVPKLVCDRIVYAIKQRITKPFTQYSDIWWMGFGDSEPNNWNPWIVSNVLTAVMLTESDEVIRKNVLDKAFSCLDNFVDTYAPDGGCNEGPGYWGAAGAALFDALEIIYDATNGKANYFDNELIYNMLDYIRKVHITDNYFTPFADCAIKNYEKGLHMSVRMGIRTGNAPLRNFALSITNTLPDTNESRFHLYRLLKNIIFKMPEKETYTPQEFDALNDLQVAVARKKNGFTVAAKGGHNNESHNHNDVGNFIVYYDGEPFIIDIGAPTYTKDLFSSKRYTVFPTDSIYHNLPVINGLGQKNGREFEADRFEASENKITIEYQSAYKREANAKKCVREIVFGENAVTVNENVSYSGGEIVFNYYMSKKPVSHDGNILLYDNGVKIACPEGFDFSIEEVKLEDAKLVANWNGNVLYKLVINANTDGNVNFSLIIEK